jgi:hypothetical protein
LRDNAQPGIGGRGSAHAGDAIGEISSLIGRHGPHHVGHGAVIAVAAVVLVRAKRLLQLIFALAGDARDVVAAGKIRLGAGAAAKLLGERLRARHARRLAGIG